MAERDEGATGSQSAMVSGEPVVDIDTVAEAAVADQDVAIARKDSGKPEKPIHALASMLGPAFIAAVAYVDPGNVAANLTSGRNMATCSSGCSCSRTVWPCSFNTRPRNSAL